MLSAKVSAALNKQIEMEGSSSQYYLAMASWAETQGLNGVSAFLYVHTDEERMHMLKLLTIMPVRNRITTTGILMSNGTNFSISLLI